ncbi:MAG: glycosyltransferase, partial [Ktedonobacterales bacterium]
VPEIVDDGEQGFLIRPGDGASLADRIERLVGDESLRKAMGAAARHKVLARFDARDNASTLLDVMKRVAREPAWGRSK